MTHLLNLIELECNIHRIADARRRGGGHGLRRLFDRQAALRLAVMRHG